MNPGSRFQCPALALSLRHQEFPAREGNLFEFLRTFPAEVYLRTSGKADVSLF